MITLVESDHFLWQHKDSDTISSFKSKLKSFYFNRLLNAFDGDNFRSFKLICPKCRRANTSSVCTC